MNFSPAEHSGPVIEHPPRRVALAARVSTRAGAGLLGEPRKLGRAPRSLVEGALHLEPVAASLRVHSRRLFGDAARRAWDQMLLIESLEELRAACTKDLRRLVRLSGPTPLAEARDRALFLLGFAAGLRRSELVALDVRDLEESEHGLVVHLRRSKTDQEGAGEQRGVPMGQHPETCPVRALRHWLAVSEINEGPVFPAINPTGASRDSALREGGGPDREASLPAGWARP